jgi:hypothetical protein
VPIPDAHMRTRPDPVAGFLALWTLPCAGQEDHRAPIMTRMRKMGTCSLCLEKRSLSFEHVPPRRVFNNRPAVAHTLYGLHLGSKHSKSPPLLRGAAGLGRNALCEQCNGRTAALYGDAFAEWTLQCLDYARRLHDTSTVLLPFTIKPLNVLKQIATMMIAVADTKTSSPSLNAIRHFVLSPQAMHLPYDVVVKAYFNPNDPARNGKPALTQNRLSESCAVLDIRSGTSVFVLAEVAFPPMGYVAYFAKRHDRVSDDFTSLCDLRQFSCHPVNRAATIFFQMPVRYPFGPVPGYYPNLNDPKLRQFVDDNHVLVTGKDAAPRT